MPSQFTTPAPGITLATATPANVVTQSLDVGVYMVWGQVDFGFTAATATNMKIGLSTTSAQLPTQAGGNGWGPEPLAVAPFGLVLLTDTVSQQVGPTVLTLNARTTVYLVASATFAVGAITACGTLCAVPIVGAGHNLLMS